MPVSDTMASLVVERIPVGIGLLDSSGRFVQVNIALARLLQRVENELLGCSPAQVGLLSGTTADHERAEQIALLAGRLDVVRKECALHRPTGTAGWAAVTLSLLDPEPAPLLLLHAVDATERNRVMAELAHQARTDPLTGLPNRREWQSQLESRLREPDRGRGPLGLAVLDIDRFKMFNDRHGHADGDRLLVGTAKQWSDIVAWFAFDACLARIGGEEFGVLLPDLPELAAEATVNRMIGSLPRAQSAGAGLTWAMPGDDVRTIMQRADAALYHAKRSGRGRVVTTRGEPHDALANTG